MDISSKPPNPPVVFSDDVDGLVEFVDNDRLEAAAADVPNNGPPILTDVVDRVVEFSDASAGANYSEIGKQQPPLFVDTVDNVFEFFDGPVQGAVKGKVAAI